MTSKAQRKRSDAAVAAFHAHYGSDKNWGHDRWTTSLYPALCKPKVYATVPNTILGVSRTPVPPSPEENDAAAKAETSWSPLPFTLTSTPTAALPIPLVPDSDTSLLSHYTLDPASIIPVALLSASSPSTILDLCAAPGGKSFLLASAHPTSTLHANEPDPTRHKRLATVLAAYLPPSVLQHITLLHLDGAASDLPRRLPALPRRTADPHAAQLPGYDAVLLDAPCSAERHVVQAHVRAVGAGQSAGRDMASFRAGGTRAVVRVQSALLMNALRVVRVGGRVVYSTCSVDGAENEGVVGAVMEKVAKGREGFGFVLRDVLDVLPGLKEVCERGKEGVGGICLPDGGERGWGPIYFCVLEKTAVVTKTGE